MYIPCYALLFLVVICIGVLPYVDIPPKCSLTVHDFPSAHSKQCPAILAQLNTILSRSVHLLQSKETLTRCLEALKAMQLQLAVLELTVEVSAEIEPGSGTSLIAPVSRAQMSRILTCLRQKIAENKCGLAQGDHNRHAQRQRALELDFAQRMQTDPMFREVFRRTKHVIRSSECQLRNRNHSLNRVAYSQCLDRIWEAYKLVGHDDHAAERDEYLTQRRKYYEARFEGQLKTDDFLMYVVTTAAYEGLSFDYTRNIDQWTDDSRLLRTKIDNLKTLLVRQEEAVHAAQQALHNTLTKCLPCTGNVLTAVAEVARARYEVSQSQTLRTNYTVELETMVTRIAIEQGRLDAHQSLIEQYIHQKLKARGGDGHVASITSSV